MSARETEPTMFCLPKGQMDTVLESAVDLIERLHGDIMETMVFKGVERKNAKHHVGKSMAQHVDEITKEVDGLNKDAAELTKQAAELTKRAEDMTFKSQTRAHTMQTLIIRMTEMADA